MDLTEKNRKMQPKMDSHNLENGYFAAEYSWLLTLCLKYNVVMNL